MDPYRSWEMNVMKKDLIELCMDHPPGTPVHRLHMLYQHIYGKPLEIQKSDLEAFLRSFPELRFSSSGELSVWHSTGQVSPASSTSSISSAPGGHHDPAATKTCSAKRRSKESPRMVLENVVSMLKQHPGGIPLKKMAESYNKTYHHNLSVSALGFKSMLSLVTSQDGELVVEGELVFHVAHRPRGRAGAEVGTTSTALASGMNCPATPQKSMSKPKPRSPAPGASLPQSATDLHYGPPPSTTISFGGPLGSAPVASSTSSSTPLISVPNTSKSSGNLTQERLLQRVFEVIKAYSYANASLDQLQNCYFLHFGEKLPLQQYMSVYESWESTRKQTTAPAPKEITDQASGPNVDQVIAPLKQPGATPKKLVKDDHQLAPSKRTTAGKASDPASSLINQLINTPATPPVLQAPASSLINQWSTRPPLIATPPATLPVLQAPASTLINHWSTRPPLIATPPLLQAPVSVTAACDSDFPALSELDNMSKTQQKRLLREEVYRKASVLPKEEYNAQLREVHGANMRAADVLMAEEEDMKSRRQKRVLDPDMVNSLMQDVIRDIATEGELVTKDKVIFRVCTLMQVPSLEAGRIKPWQIPALKDLQYLIREIHMFIEATEAAAAMCTLYELGQSLAALKDKNRYEELHLGPLCKLPLIHRMFKIDSNTKDDDIHQIETVDILRNLRMFRRTASQKNKPKIDLADFMKYLADHYNSDSPYELGIRIHSMGLPIASLIKVTRQEHLYLQQAQEVIQRELEEEALERMRKIKRSVMEPAQGPVMFSSLGGAELRKKYVSMTAAEAVLAVFTNAAEVFSPKMTKRVMDFLLLVSSDRLSTTLFQLAICGGSLATPQDLVAKEKPSKKTEQNDTEDKSTAAPPSEVAVKQYLKDSLSSHSSAVTLAHISSLEKKLIKHFQVKEFLSLEKGTFLEFLVKHIQVLQETVGGAVSLGGVSAESQGCGFRPSRQDVFEFIKQCGAGAASDADALSHIECALRSHYGVHDSRDLGFGPLRTLAALVQRQRDMLIGGGLSQVYYESALFAKHSSSAGGLCESVGLLGEVSQTRALASLLSCPLLEDLGQWSQWELVFRPLHGALKDFIERHAVDTDLAALEVSPDVLLRITTSTGDKLFSQAAMALDPVGTAGHLVSMVVADGIANAPTALLANHLETSLAEAVAKEDLSQAEEDISCYGTVARFLLDCVVRIPTRTCQALLKQVFLEPFSRVLGQAKSKAVLLSVARSDPRHLNRLHQLGILLGITDWVKDYHSKLVPPQKPSHPCTAPVVVQRKQRKSNLVDSVSSEDEDLEDANVDDSLISSHAQQQDVVEEEDLEEEDEELYELTSVPNGEAHSFSPRQSEAEGSNVDEEEEEVQVELIISDEEDAASSQSESAVNLQEVIINDIRKSEFGVGVELNAEGEKLMKVHQDRLGRSLDRLSAELYSKDTHFVLELIQNADDNSYPSDGTVPALAFVVERDCITILNNESGFREENIRAICDVGRTTKGKHQYGYIGQKGIGFKSVFKVTDCPEVHSNGFHLRFDKNCGPMGYILPHWVEDERPLDMNLNGIDEQSWTTRICLPLRSESHQTRNLFHDVHPSLLLFLHRLRSITIYNQSKKEAVTMTRRDLSHSVLEVEHPEGTERWLVVKRTLLPKKIKEDVESTEIALAFQLGDDITGSDLMGTQPQKQPVFAFLPLRSFGFRFIVQGDFDIPSSREDVDRDSSWNQWLRSEIPQLFLQAMDVFSNHPEFSGLKGLCHFLQFVPLPDEVLDFFKPVAGQIIQLLKGKAFLPTLGPDGDVLFKLPSQVAVCQDAVILDVIGREELDRHLSLAYLHPGLRPAPPISLLSHLGVRQLRGSDVTTVTTAMAKELMQGEGGITSERGLHQLARLLVCNFRALEHGYGDVDSVLQTLKELPIIPLADGRLVALSGEGVFFPMEESATSKRKAKTQTGPFSALYKDVSVVHPTLLSCVDPLESQQVRELLRRLGVHELQPQQLLEQHIYPALRSSSWKSKPEAVVVSYLVFIKQHSTSSEEYSDTAVPVLTNRGLLCPAQDRVHFSAQYDNMDLANKLPGYEWSLLSPCYVETDGDVEGWRQLFSRLGVRDHLIIRKERRTFTAAELASSPWAVESSQWAPCQADGSFVLDDFPSEEFLSLATAQQLPAPRLLEQRRALLELLETNWDTGDRYSQYCKAHVIDSDGRQIRPTKSSFFHFLSRLQWVPAYLLQEGGKQEAKYLCPNSVYLFSTEVHSLLGTHVCYLDTRPSEFSKALGMRHSVSVDELAAYLKKWCVKEPQPGEEEEEEESQGSEFTSTVQHIHNVYTYLHKNCSHDGLRELFHHTPAVFIEYSRRDGDWCSGSFYHLKEVCWSDPTCMFQRYRNLTRSPDSSVREPRVLAPFYDRLEGMRDLFNRLNVEPSPNMNQYVGLLELICFSSPIPTAEVLQDVSVLYARLAHKCKIPVSGEQEYTMTDPNYCSTLKGMVSDKKVFPTKDNTWVTLADRPMIADSKELEKIFKPYRQFYLLNLPPADRKRAKPDNQYGPGDHRGNTMPAFKEEDRSLFLDICGVGRMSQRVRTEAQTENLRPCPSLQKLVRTVVPYIQRFLCHHEELAHVYQELLDSDIGERMKKVSYGQVGKLYIRYQLTETDDKAPVVELQDVICLLKDQKELYIQKDHLSAKLDICRELVKLFCTEVSHRKDLMHFLSGLMTSLDDAGALKRFLLKEDIKELAFDEEPWEVPEPLIPEYALERVSSKGPPSVGNTDHPGQADGEQTLMCWPPRASILNTGGRTGAPMAGAVEAVMKMWPPPAAPKDRDPDSDTTPKGSGGHHVGLPQSHSSGGGGYEGNQPADLPALPASYTDHSHPSAGAGLPSISHAAGSGRVGGTLTTHSTGDPSSDRDSGGGLTPAVGPRQRTAAADHAKMDDHEPNTANNHSAVPEAVLMPSVFQGTGGAGEGQRPPMALDPPMWNKVQPPKDALEDLELVCQRPSTVVLSDEPRALAEIGEWGEQLVNSFLCHWRDTDAPEGRPAHITWCNQNGETGQPYDFKLSFGGAGGQDGGEEGTTTVVYVEVKSTVKREKAFIHLSANELDFALKERERYHIYRVYSAGDAQGVRLCRIRNLAQHLHTKDVELFLFV